MEKARKQCMNKMEISVDRKPKKKPKGNLGVEKNN